MLIIINNKSMKIKGGLICIGIGMLMLFGFSGTAFAAATITGTITTASDGLPVDSILMYIENADTGDIEYDYADAAGLYSVSVDAGDYFIYNSYYAYDTTEPYYIQNISDTFTIADGETATKNLSLIKRGNIEGYVYESDGITPIYNAYIYASNNADSTVDGDDYSAASGFYSIIPQSGWPDYDYTLSSEGNYDVYASATNYFPAYTTSTSITNENTTSLNFTLSPASVVSGIITDANGDPLEGATLSLNGYMSGYYYGSSTTVAADGTYSFHVYNTIYYNGNAIGSYTMAIAKSGYISQTDAIAIFEAEENIIDNNYTLIEGGTITGHVYEADGTTVVSGATISGDDGFGNTYSTTSGSDGLYSLGSLRTSDDYILTASKSNFITKKKYHVDVTKGETTEDQDFNLADAIIFSGTITDKDGNAVEGATILLYKRSKPRSSTADFSATSLSDGTFSFTTIVPDLYRIKITKTGYIAYKKERLNLKNDKTDSSYEMTAASSIYGRITNNGAGVESATIYIHGKKKDSDYGYTSTSTDNDGYYRINNLKSGTYKIRVVTTNFAEKIVTKKLTAGREKEINIKVKKAGSISGYATDKESGIPLSGYYLRIKGLTNGAYTDANGYYIIDGLSPGKYKVYMYSSLYGTTFYHTKVQVKVNKETKNINFNLIIEE